ncbi:hypothetical protein [Flavobacterium sp.]|uniref:hypothetical protein n=1 Tax=Flavobacterium sp. TaxID=239 RepID=UPI003753231B
MKAFLKKIFNVLNQNKSSDTKILRRQTENLILREGKKSDTKRWKNNEELLQNWDERTIILGSFIIPYSNIIEFGAGNMVLKDTLTNYKSYTPSDIVPRFKETIVCDLNQAISFDLTNYDAAVFSGVLEYVYDIEKVIEQMRAASVNQIVLSYSCADIVKLSRDKNGWLSDYTKEDLAKIFKKRGYAIDNYQEWRNQSLYNLIKK